MSEELELSGKSENTAPAESAAEPAAEPSPAPAPVQRVSAHNTAAAAALNAANEEVDIRRKEELGYDELLFRKDQVTGNRIRKPLTE